MRPKLKPLRKTRRKCPTRKIRFDDEYEAERALNHHDEPDKDYHPVRAYYCSKCTGWHLTSIRWRNQGPATRECCGGTVGERHELSCETVSPEEFFARTGGRVPRQEEQS